MIRGWNLPSRQGAVSGQQSLEPVRPMALKAFIPLAVVAAILVGLLMPVPGHRKAEATQSRIETIDIKN